MARAQAEGRKWSGGPVVARSRIGSAYLVSALIHLVGVVVVALAPQPWRKPASPPALEVSLVDSTPTPEPRAKVEAPRTLPPPEVPVEKAAETFKSERERKPEKAFEKKAVDVPRAPRIPDIRRLIEQKIPARVTAKAEGPKPKTVEPVEPTPRPRPEPAPVSPAPEAKPAAPAVAAVPSVSAGVELPDFRYPYYLKLIQGKISGNWMPPPVELGDDLREVVVSFSLLNNGKIASVNVEKSSGNPFYDQAALRAVYAADPLPKFPDGLRESTLRVHFSFVLGRKG